MAVEFCSETTSSSGCCVAAMSSSSPRISFSHDLLLSQNATPGDGVPPPIEQYIRSNSSSSSIDFDFCVFRESFDQEYSSSADELFFDGKILPIEIKKKLGTASKKSSPPSSPSPLGIDFHSSSSSTTSRKGKKNEKVRDQNLNTNSNSNSNIIIDSEEKQSSSSSSSSNSNKNSSWFKRSSSLNCGNGYARSLCPIPLLSRSNSTGSTPNVKRSSPSPSPSLMKDNNVNYCNYVSNSNNKQKSHHQKPPLKRSYTTSTPPYGSGVNPVLNVPTPTFFGLASIFSTTKNKKK